MSALAERCSWKDVNVGDKPAGSFDTHDGVKAIISQMVNGLTDEEANDVATIFREQHPGTAVTNISWLQQMISGSIMAYDARKK